MSNRRKLRPPPTGWDYKKFVKVILDSDLDDEVKEQLLVRAAFADNKGRVREDGRYQEM